MKDAGCCCLVSRPGESVDQREVGAGRPACVLTEVVKGPHVRSRHASLSPGLAQLSIPGQCAGLGQV